MLINYNVDMSYFTTINSFKLKNCLIGPFSQEMFLTHQFSAITRKKLNFLNSKIKKELRENGWYYIIEINSDELINYDLKLTIKGKKISFYSWFNLWYATFEIISKYVIENNYFEDDNITRYSNINSALSEINTNEINKSKNNEILNSSRISERSHFNESGGQSIMTITLTKMKAKHKYGLKRKSAIQTLKNNKDLNNICDGIDDLAKEKKVQLLDRKNLVFTIGRKQLDKLKDKKNNDNFEVKYCYELVN
jgi:hypothetical protein